MIALGDGATAATSPLFDRSCGRFSHTADDDKERGLAVLLLDRCESSAGADRIDA